MNSKTILAGSVLLGSSVWAAAADDTAELKREVEAMRGDYEARIDRLESRIRELEGSGNGQKASVNGKKKYTAGDAEMEAAQKRENNAMAAREAAREAVERRFEETTETRQIAKQQHDQAVAERVEKILESYVDITGYFRAGYGRSDQDTAQRAFGIPGVAKYRLGNEAENYGELAFSKTFYPAGIFGGGSLNAGDPVAQFVYRLSTFNPYDSGDVTFGSPEIWASLSNVIPCAPEAKLWAGQRFYRRHDIHINDFYFWDMSGGGGGIEDVPLGEGKLALAWIGDASQSAIYNHFFEEDPNNLAGFSKSSVDLRWYDWPFWCGKGEVGLTYAHATSGEDSEGREAENGDGLALSLVRTDEKFIDDNSVHKLSLQVGTGPAKTFTAGFDTFTQVDDISGDADTFIRPDPDDSWRFRATDQIVVKPCDQFSIGTALVYQYTDYDDDVPEQHWVSGGLRPIWHITEAFNIAFEGGVDYVSEIVGGDGDVLGKLTIAPQVALGDEFFSRPVLRAFLTYAAWGDELRGSVGGPDYTDRGSGWSWGLQMEAWW